MRAVLGLLIVVAVASALPLTKELYQRAWCPDGWTVRIAHRYGEVSVAGKPDVDSLEVEVKARVDGTDREVVRAFAQDVGLSVAPWAETVFVTVLYPELPEPTSELSYEVDVALSVPEATRFVADNSFGDVRVRGLLGGCRVSNGFGCIVLDGCRDCEATSRHGDVHVSDNTGALLVNNSYGDVYLDGVRADVQVDNCYGNVEGVDLEGDVVLASVMGRIVTRGGRGQLLLANRYGEVDAWIEDSALTDLDVVAELSRVQLNLARKIPFQLGGKTFEGLIRTGLPVELREEGPHRWVSGQAGRGGPKIQLTGSWADFTIGPDSALESVPARTGTGPGNGR